MILNDVGCSQSFILITIREFVNHKNVYECHILTGFLYFGDSSYHNTKLIYPRIRGSNFSWVKEYYFYYHYSLVEIHYSNWNFLSLWLHWLCQPDLYRLGLLLLRNTQWAKYSFPGMHHAAWVCYCIQITGAILVCRREGLLPKALT